MLIVSHVGAAVFAHLFDNHRATEPLSVEHAEQTEPMNTRSLHAPELQAENFWGTDPRPWATEACTRFSIASPRSSRQNWQTVLPGWEERRLMISGHPLVENVAGGIGQVAGGHVDSVGNPRRPVALGAGELAP